MATNIPHDPSTKSTPVRSLWITIGPGLVVAGSVMGSGELINTPVQAAKFGFVLLWAVLLSCVIKYFLQVEIARYCLVHNRTTHEALAQCPGPSWRGASWISLLYMLAYLVTLLTAPGMISAMAGMMHAELPLATAPVRSMQVWGGVLTLLAIALLWGGLYRHLELLVAMLVGLFSVSVAIGVWLLQGTEYRITAAEIAEGFRFSLGDQRQLAAYAVVSLLGALGTTANELFMYPYWILEKGYARELGDPTSDGWQPRMRRWVHAIRVDAGVATVLATVMTCAFFLLGAAVLHRRGAVPDGTDVVATISQIYTESFGPWSRYVFLVGAFCTLFSTLVVVAAATGRMFSDFLATIGLLDRRDTWVCRRCHQLTQTVLLAAFFVVFLFFGGAPVDLIVFAQFSAAVLCAPLIMGAICWLAFQTDRRARMSKTTAVLLLATTAIIMVCTVGGVIIKYSATS